MSKNKKKFDPTYTKIYDHKPGILGGYPSLIFLFLAGSMYLIEKNEAFPISGDSIFWIGFATTLFWYIALRFNLPKKQFFLVFGLLGTFFGIPAALEIAGNISPYAWVGRQLGTLRPEVSAGGWLIGSIAFGINWLGNYLWSRTHMKVEIKDGKLYLYKYGGETRDWDLIGLSTIEEPLDYMEVFAGGFGKLAIATRTGKKLFQMNRVFGLYRIWWMPWRKPLISKIQEALTYDAKVLTKDITAELTDVDDTDTDIEGEDEGALGDEGLDGDVSAYDDTSDLEVK